LLVCLQPHDQFSSYLVNVTITGDKVVTLDLYLTLMAFSIECSFFVSTPAGTQNLGLYSLMKRTDTHVQPSLCTYALITAARGWMYCLKIQRVIDCFLQTWYTSKKIVAFLHSYNSISILALTTGNPVYLISTKGARRV
jgi:hypothetical protein